MQLAGLSLLQIQDESGRIVSSGHFRNEYDRSDSALPRLWAAAPAGTAVVEARTAEAPFLALARVDSLRLGGRRFTLVGGIAVDSSFLARLAPDSELTVSVALPPDTSSGADPATQVVSAVTVPFVTSGDSARLLAARIVVSHSLASLVALRRGVALSFLVAVLVTGLIALLLASWLSTRISRPLTALAAKTADVDMDRLDAAFRDRQATVESSISYLENLASNYARLYPQPAGESCDVNAVVRETISRVSDTGQAELRLELAEGLRPARTDALVLRRILENLIGNALDSPAARAGHGR